MRRTNNSLIIRHRRLLIPLAVLLIAGCPFALSGHPLGNFTISHFARLEIGRDRINVRYVIDMAEIPTFQEMQAITNDGNQPSKAELDSYLKRVVAGYADGLVLQIENARVPLVVDRESLTLLPGAAGAQTTRIECDFVGALPPGRIDQQTVKFEDRNYGERIGWREIVVSPIAGISVFNSSAFGSGVTNELRSYPGEMLAAPLNERTAEFSFVRGPMPPAGRPLFTRAGSPVVPAPRDRLAELVQLPELTLGLGLLGMLTAIFWGGLHALSPGHGKTVVAAYLVGSRGTVRHAGFLGLTVTITHTAGVIALGLVTLLASRYILPERLIAPLSLISGLMVAAIGFSLLRNRLRTALGLDSLTHTHSHDKGVHSHNPNSHTHAHHQHHHDGVVEEHSHEGGNHSHLPPGADGSAITWRSLLALGISGGLLPCPSALVILLAAISNRRIGFGLLLVVAFSVGLAGVLTAVGIAFVYAGRLIIPIGRFDRVTRLLPVFSALVIACAGLVICYGALNQAGLFG